MVSPKTLSQYPWVVVRLECKLCPRKGAYKLARLAALYGPEFALDQLLAALASDCPWWHSEPRKYEPRCGVRFIDLDRNMAPPDHPEAPVYRQRQPQREDVPKHRSVSHLRFSETPTLSGWPIATLAVTCDRCGHRETWLTAELLSVNGDIRLTDLLTKLTASCQRRQATSVYEQCGARYEMPG